MGGWAGGREGGREGGGSCILPPVATWSLCTRAAPLLLRVTRNRELLDAQIIAAFHDRAHCSSGVLHAFPGFSISQHMITSGKTPASP